MPLAFKPNVEVARLHKSLPIFYIDSSIVCCATRVVCGAIQSFEESFIVKYIAVEPILVLERVIGRFINILALNQIFTIDTQETKCNNKWVVGHIWQCNTIVKVVCHNVDGGIIQ